MKLFKNNNIKKNQYQGQKKLSNVKKIITKTIKKKQQQNINVYL